MRHLLLSAMLLTAAPLLAGVPAKPKPPKGSPEEVICKREEVTGSLAQMRKVCATRAQWAAQSDASQRPAQELEDRGRVNSCGAATLGC